MCIDQLRLRVFNNFVPRFVFYQGDLAILCFKC